MRETGPNENNNQDKTAAWVMVTQEYNVLGLGPQRFPQGLLNRWKLMKKNARKEKSFERKDMCKTGGGLPATRKRLLHPSLVDVVLGIISKLSVEGDKNSVDSNADFELYCTSAQSHIELIEEDGEFEFQILQPSDQNADNKNMNQQLPIEEEANDFQILQPSDLHANNKNMNQQLPTGEETLDETSWNKWKPKNLKRKISKPLAPPITSHVTKKKPNNYKQFQQNLNLKEEVLKKQLEHFTQLLTHEANEEDRRLREHTLRMKLMQEDADKKEKREAELHRIQVASYKGIPFD